ncbi:4-hydroxythreonine-4-phosphate dehydrogenase/glyoxylate reductase [Acididesulfobacillus acetoxydans]|uniref:4-hydroxythreonine-4-phosphate dehydrogenase n=1 Tax=Acididesulfobacillus acetoxydans TaxID=1561005 RepID=A0A8S0Y0D8_9FIRM|nr:4-hydroxythreonine-4-phosphate dehydrogenase PdxA [Acididesulfobacillus acetoxydans]CAA7603057.1 4-hydroxythreonine-4-phosphate dehydrogenase/glyoxylate reductase [Acididesulfobacillus acetoxydans]CEJ08709.1 4-hydroxythreonine-4-phosphate dehydrogenase [Acididesulfobacillus acetoxydans]
MKPIVAITIGDAAGIGPEIVAQALAKEYVYDMCRPLVIGDQNVLQKANDLLKLHLQTRIVSDPAEGRYELGTIDMVDCKNIDSASFHVGKPDGMTGRAMIEYTNRAVGFLKANAVHAAIGGPHSKKAVDQAGISFAGYPNLVTKLTSAKRAFLMLVAGDLRVASATLHVSMRKACDLINKDLVLDIVSKVNEAVKLLGVERPRIAVAGLNAHAGEEGMFGDEEIFQISPAIEAARAQGIDVYGPFAGDSLFYKCLEHKYDAYVGMYHDQGHIALKTLALDKSCGLIIGTPVLFATVGHGCAQDIAWKGIADPGSMLETIRVVSSMHMNRSALSAN